MKTNIFHLQIIPVKNVLPHEVYDQSRAKPLVARLKKDGYLGNPIIVASLDNGKYLQLDGMNRFSAFRMMKIPTILAQIIDYNDQDIVELSSWAHLFQSGKDAFFNYLSGINGISVKRGNMENVGHRYIREEGMARLCTITHKDKSVYLIVGNDELSGKIRKLNKIVSFYKNHIIRDVLYPRTSALEVELLFKEHEPTNWMIVFPTFTRHQIVDVVKRGGLFPTGVTRHIIKRRCLNVKIPVAFFSKGKSLKEQNAELEKILMNQTFRLYEEPTIYFE